MKFGHIILFYLIRVGLSGAEERLQSIFWNTNQQEGGEYCLRLSV